MRTATPLPPDVLDTASRIVWDGGIRMLQAARLGRTDLQHIASLLGRFDPPQNARIVDLGCGFGEPARLMHQIRQDLRFVLVNNNAWQLDKAPQDFDHHLADMHEMPLQDASMDAAMALYSLCHSNLAGALSEAARVVRPGGKLLVYDYHRRQGDNRLMDEVFHACAWGETEWQYCLRRTGWKTSHREKVIPVSDRFRELMEPNLYHAIFDDLDLMIRVAVRQ